MAQLQRSSLLPMPIWKITKGNIVGGKNQHYILNSDNQLNQNRNRCIKQVHRNDFSKTNPWFQSKIPVRVTNCHPINHRQTPQSLETTSTESSISNSSSSSSTDSTEQEEEIGYELAKKLTEPYLSDIMTTMLLKEATYKYHFQYQSSRKIVPKRSIIVQWVISAGQLFNYTDDTIHLSVFIIDAFLNTKWLCLKSQEWPLLALTALHLAAKWEEVNPVTLLRIMETYKQVLWRFECEDVNRMETEILNELKFEICPPTSTFFADLFINSGYRQFNNEQIKRQTIRLTHAILIESLNEYYLSQVFPSKKAQVAIQVAAQYLENLKTIGQFPVKGHNDFIDTDSIRKCFELFYNTILQNSQSQETPIN